MSDIFLQHKSDNHNFVLPYRYRILSRQACPPHFIQLLDCRIEVSFLSLGRNIGKVSMVSKLYRI